MTAQVEFDGRYRFPYRVILARDGQRRCYSRHKTRSAADASLAKLERSLAHFEAVKPALAETVS